MRGLFIAGLVGCRGDETSAAPNPDDDGHGAGRLCVYAENGTPRANSQVSMGTATTLVGATWSKSDASGCISLADLPEGLYRPIPYKTIAAGQIYIRRGDSLRVDVEDARTMDVSYAAPAPVSAMLTLLSRRPPDSQDEWTAAVDEALLAPKGSELRLAGLLASFEMTGWANPKAAPQWPKHSPELARELIEMLPDGSRLLTAWPTATGRRH